MASKTTEFQSHALLEHPFRYIQERDSEETTIFEYFMRQLSHHDVEIAYPSNFFFQLLVEKEFGYAAEPAMRPSSPSFSAVCSAIAAAKQAGIGCCMVLEKELLEVLPAIASIIDENIPCLILLLSSAESDAASSFRALAHSLGKQSLDILQDRYIEIFDTKSAAVRIDRALDLCSAYQTPVVVEMSEDVAADLLPAHEYEPTLFLHEQTSLFQSVWDTIFSRLQHAKNSVIIIGKQIRQRSQHLLLANIADRFDADILIDPEIAGTFLYDAPLFMTNEPILAEIVKASYDALFCFGVEPGHIWLQVLLANGQEHLLTHHETLSINSASVLFDTDSDPLPISFFNDFFQHRIPSRSLAFGQPSTTTMLLDLAYPDQLKMAELFSHINFWICPSTLPAGLWAAATAQGLYDCPGTDGLLLASNNEQVLEEFLCWYDAQPLPQKKLGILFISNEPPHKFSERLSSRIWIDFDSFQQWLKIPDGQNKPGPDAPVHCCILPAG